MNMKSWAEKEVELACKKECPDREDGEWDYGCACYESALKAYNSLMEDGHSGFSIGITRDILNRLIDGKPLTPIKDTEDIWSTADEDNVGRLHYQCVRMFSLFKVIDTDGAVTYSDVSRYVCVDKNNRNNVYNCGLVERIIDEMFPITMPYVPDDSSWEIYCEDFLFDENCGDFDTVGIFYIIKPDGEKVDIDRFFIEKDGDWEECDIAEYLSRRERRIK